jgi:hypothetical protein
MGRLPFLWYGRSSIGRHSLVRVPAADGGVLLKLCTVHTWSIRQSLVVGRPADDRLRATIGLGAFFNNTRLEAAVCHHIQHSHRSCCPEELLVFSNPVSVYLACQTTFLRQRRSSCPPWP